MATKTGKMVVDPHSGLMVEEMREDQMLVALYDPNVADQTKLDFQKVLRSDFKLQKINMLFNCHAAYIKDQFGNVIWPKDWMTQGLPPMGHDKWFYIIHERLEPVPRDDLRDAMYTGDTALLLTYVPKVCDEIDIKTWLLYGIGQDYAPLSQMRTEIALAERKLQLLKAKIAALPSLEVEGTPEQQAEIRKKLSDAITSHKNRFERQIEELTRKKNRVEGLVMTEPLTLTMLPNEKTEFELLAQRAKHGNKGGEEELVDTHRWVVVFRGTRSRELLSVALDKSDWNYICVVKTRPQPRAFVEADQVEHQVISAKDMEKEINMRTVRLARLRHGEGEWLESSDGTSPWQQEFHISSINTMYAGEWKLGEKHGRGREVTNVGIYEGEYVDDGRVGHGKLVYGKGTTCEGVFARPKRQYEYGKRCKEMFYTPSLLNTTEFRDGIENGEHMKLTFPDGATYEGEMRDGTITGYGRYVSSTGVIDEGYFAQGVLNGDGCRRQLPNGTVQEGMFVNGELDGIGRLREKTGDTYEGFFERGAKQGRGVSYFNQRHCKHVGFWHEDAMDGRGDFYYHDKHKQPQPKTKGKANVEEKKTTAKAKKDDPIKPTARDQPENPDGDPEASKEEGKDKDKPRVLLGDEEDEDWDFWYEGSFVQGVTQVRHRNVDLKHNHVGHLPFTTNGKSEEKMPFLTLTLPTQLKKTALRRKKNGTRRWRREKEYLEKREHANLTLYYRLLDEFYEKWATAKRQQHDDAQLDPGELERVREERAAIAKYEANRIKFRKEQYDLSPRKKELETFEAHLERITLTEHVALERAMNNEASTMIADISKVQAMY
ncbi:TPA: hypothetical protein N0F65_002500 [Lagenidium giganteum]|uniref:Uncharacterized protein n=1 Tax=Lagenidium giganteum TaxID=4803 RepID=A0AAV2YUP0_9STRA|nr:TPA: hypothetical protein N0F65_002500 [Lagenidium giganteum]